MVVFGQRSCIREKILYSGKVVAVRQKWLYSGKCLYLGKSDGIRQGACIGESCSIWVKVAVLRQNGCT